MTVELRGRRGAQPLAFEWWAAAAGVAARSNPAAQLPAALRRCRHLTALVSRRWHEAAHSPNVLRSIESIQPSLAQLQSLTAWLRRMGGMCAACGCMICT